MNSNHFYGRTIRDILKTSKLENSIEKLRKKSFNGESSSDDKFMNQNRSEETYSINDDNSNPATSLNEDDVEITHARARKSTAESIVSLVPKENIQPLDRDIDLINDIISKQSNSTITISDTQNDNTNSLSDSLFSLDEKSQSKNIPVQSSIQISKMNLNTLGRNQVEPKRKYKTRTRTTLSDLKIGQNGDKKENGNEETSNRLRTRSMLTKEVPQIEENLPNILKLNKSNKVAPNGEIKGAKPIKRLVKKKPIDVKIDQSTTKKRSTSPVVSLAYLMNPQEAMETEINEPVDFPLTSSVFTNKPSTNQTPIVNKSTGPNVNSQPELQRTPVKNQQPTQKNQSQQKSPKNSQPSRVSVEKIQISSLNFTKSPKKLQKSNTVDQEVKEEMIYDPDKDNQETLRIPTNFREQKSIQKTKKIDQMILKLVYLNTAGSIDGRSFESILKTYNLNHEHDHLVKNQNLKCLVNKKFVDYIDNEISTRTSQSPLYSLIIETDDTHSAIYASIQFLDHVDNLDRKMLIKLFDVKPVQELFKVKMNDIFEIAKQNGRHEFMLSKYLFDQIRLNVITHFKLNPRNFFCISIDIDILSRLCFSSIQTYLKDLFNKDILILPRFNVQKSLNQSLTECKFNSDSIKFSLKDYFNTYQQILMLIDSGKLVGIPDFYKSYFIEFEFDLNNIESYIKIVDSIYLNYSLLTSRIIENKMEPIDLINTKRELRDKISSLDFYYMTCLLEDLFKFLDEYRLNSKKFSSRENFVLTWCLEGSCLKFLQSEQLSDQFVNNKSTVKVESRVNETIEIEDDSFSSLNKIKDSIEEMVKNKLDMCSDMSSIKCKYLNLISSDSMYETQSQDLPLKIYSYLNELFDVDFKDLNLDNQELKVNLSLSDEKITCLTDYYFFEFRTEQTVQNFREEYDLFFNSFLEFLSNESIEKLKSDLVESNSTQSKTNVTNYTRSLLETDSQIKKSFLEFTNKNTRDKVYRTINFLALIYLIVPSIVDMQSKNKSDKKSLSMSELVDYELKLKFIDSLETRISKQKSLIDLDNISFMTN